MAELQFDTRPPDDHQLTAIVIDDETTMQVLLSKLLKQCGCRVVGRAGNGRDGLELFLSKRPDITFMDINMPRQDGMETLEKMRQECPDARICMVSADAFSTNVKKAVALGAAGFIVKPLTIRRVEDFVARVRADSSACSATQQPAATQAAPAEAKPVEEKPATTE
jgi:YesN/AraC family two-component response regulator